MTLRTNLLQEGNIIGLDQDKQSILTHYLCKREQERGWQSLAPQGYGTWWYKLGCGCMMSERRLKTENWLSVWTNIPTDRDKTVSHQVTHWGGQDPEEMQRLLKLQYTKCDTLMRTLLAMQGDSEPPQSRGLRLQDRGFRAAIKDPTGFKAYKNLLGHMRLPPPTGKEYTIKSSKGAEILRGVTLERVMIKSDS